MGSGSASDRGDRRGRNKMSPKSNGITTKSPASGSPANSKQVHESLDQTTVPESPKERAVPCPCSPNLHQKDKTVTTPKTGSPFKMAKKDKRSPGLDFNEYTQLSQRITQSMYYAKKMPSVSRPSFPLTVLAVNAFTSTNLGTKLDTLEFLDLELASEIGINACVSPTTLIMTLVYLERLHFNNPAYLKSIKPSELFVISLLVASKFIQDDGEDCGIYNDEWAASAKMETKDVNRLEIEFLSAIDWNVNVSRDEFDKALQNLECRLAQQEGEKRGSFTYTELEKLSKAILTWNLIWPTVYEYAIKVVVAASITYATLVTTLLASSFVAPRMVQLLSRSLTMVQAPSTSFPVASRSGYNYNNCNCLPKQTLGNGDGGVTLTPEEEETIEHILLQVPDLENNSNSTNFTFFMNDNGNNNSTNAFKFKMVFNSESQESSCSNLDYSSGFKERAISFNEVRLENQLTDYQNRLLHNFNYNSCSARIKLNNNYRPQNVNAFAQFISL